MDIKEKIAHLRKLVKENGATEAEALAAFELANKLMEKYGITEDELSKVKIDKDMKTFLYQTSATVHPASLFTASKIAAFCEVMTWLTKDFGDQGLVFFGLNDDVDTAEFLIHMVTNTAKSAWTVFLKIGNYNRSISRHELYHSFFRGFANRINVKINELITLRQSPSSNGTSLVVRKDTLLQQARDQLFGTDFSKARASSTTVDSSTFIAGQRAGDAVNLNRPLSQAAEGRLLT